MLYVLWAVVFYLPWLWLWPAIYLRVARIMGYKGARWANILVYWLRWPSLVCFLVKPVLGVLVHEWPANSPWRFVLLGSDIMIWWLYRDEGDDDDRFKRLRKKLSDKVKSMGSRLVVVPVG